MQNEMVPVVVSVPKTYVPRGPFKRSAAEQLKELDARLGSGQGAKRERAKIAIRLLKEAEAEALKSKTTKKESKPKQTKSERKNDKSNKKGK